VPKVIVPAAGQYGLIADQPAQELPPNAWTTVANMRFRDGCAEKFLGHAMVFTAPSVTPYYLQPYATSTVRFWVHAGLASVFSDDGTTRDDITGTPLTATSANRFTGGVLNGVMVLNNQADVPQFWAGTGNLASLTGWDANWRAKSVRPFKNFLVALHVTKTATVYPHMVKWSDAADPGAVPGSWDEADASKLAGELDLAETADWMVDSLPLGDMNVIYKQRSMYAMRFVGGTQVFEFRRLPGNYGMLTQGCAVETPMGHVVLCAGDVVLHNGGEPKSIVSGRVRSWLFETQIDPTNVAKCFVAANPGKSEVWVCYPEVGQSTCTAALVWNWDSDTWTRRALPNILHASAGLLGYTTSDAWSADSATWDSDATAWDQNDLASPTTRLLMASTAPAIYLADSGLTFAGSTNAATLERTGLTFGDPDRVKIMKSISPRIEAPAGTQISITFGASVTAEESPTWGDPVTYTVGSTFKADSFATGRFLAVRFSDSGGQRWRVKSFTADVQAMGEF
jgi:hypothetical protein